MNILSNSNQMVTNLHLFTFQVIIVIVAYDILEIIFVANFSLLGLLLKVLKSSASSMYLILDWKTIFVIVNQE